MKIEGNKFTSSHLKQSNKEYLNEYCYLQLSACLTKKGLSSSIVLHFQIDGKIAGIVIVSGLKPDLSGALALLKEEIRKNSSNIKWNTLSDSPGTKQILKNQQEILEKWENAKKFPAPTKKV